MDQNTPIEVHTITCNISGTPYQIGIMKNTLSLSFLLFFSPRRMELSELTVQQYKTLILNETSIHFKTDDINKLDNASCYPVIKPKHSGETAIFRISR